MAACCRRAVLAGGAANGIGILVGSAAGGGCWPNPMVSLSSARPLSTILGALSSRDEQVAHQAAKALSNLVDPFSE